MLKIHSFCLKKALKWWWSSNFGQIWCFLTKNAHFLVKKHCFFKKFGAFGAEFWSSIGPNFPIFWSSHPPLGSHPGVLSEIFYYGNGKNYNISSPKLIKLPKYLLLNSKIMQYLVLNSKFVNISDINSNYYDFSICLVSIKIKTVSNVVFLSLFSKKNLGKDRWTRV